MVEIIVFISTVSCWKIIKFYIKALKNKSNNFLTQDGILCKPHGIWAIRRKICKNKPGR